MREIVVSAKELTFAERKATSKTGGIFIEIEFQSYYARLSTTGFLTRTFAMATDNPIPDPGDAADTDLPPVSDAASAETAVIDAARLFGAAREVQIELDGVRYRLRITRRGKLILQK